MLTAKEVRAAVDIEKKAALNSVPRYMMFIAQLIKQAIVAGEPNCTFTLPDSRPYRDYIYGAIRGNLEELGYTVNGVTYSDDECALGGKCSCALGISWGVK